MCHGEICIRVRVAEHNRGRSGNEQGNFGRQVGPMIFLLTYGFPGKSGWWY